MKLQGGIYHKTQIDLTYNPYKIEESRHRPLTKQGIFLKSVLLELRMKS